MTINDLIAKEKRRSTIGMVGALAMIGVLLVSGPAAADVLPLSAEEGTPVAPNFAATSKIEIKFTPSMDCERSIIGLIDKAQNTIDVAIYAINNDRIIKALKNAYDRGIKIRILADKLQASSKYSKVIDLHNYGINIRVHSKNKIEHNKFAVYDDKVASSGSYNWTNSATERNSENCIFLIEDAEAVKTYQDRFNYLWQINTKNKSDEWFLKKSACQRG